MQKYFKPQNIAKSFQSYKARVWKQMLISHFRVLLLSWFGILARQRNVVKQNSFTQFMKVLISYGIVNSVCRFMPSM